MSETSVNEKDGSTNARVANAERRGINCVKCGKVSDESSRFCGGCGARLWEPCPACETVNPIDQRFCGGCGLPIEEALATARREAETVLNDAKQKCEQGHFVDAIQMLDGIKIASHSGLDDLREHVQAQSKEFSERRESVASSADSVLEEARALAESGRIRQALEVAKRIPSALRGLELRTLCDDLEPRVDELRRLRKQVQQGLAEKDYAGVYGPVKRLVEIDPTDDKMNALAAKLDSQRAKLNRAEGRKHLKSALAALKACDYRAAEKHLAKAPEGEMDEKTAKALAGARERVWLAHQLARAPFANEALVAVADRLAKLQSHDDKVAQLRLELMRRWKEGIRNDAGRPIVWQKPAEDEPGLDVAPLSGGESASKRLAKKGYPFGQFAVAFGLAIQASGGAEFDIDLAPKRRSWSSRLSLGRGRKKGAAVAWGVDIGSHSVKALRLVVPESGGDPVVDEVVLAPVSRDDADTNGRTDSSLPAGAAEAVAKLLAEQDFADAAVAVGMSSALTLGRFFELPRTTPSKFEEAIRYEARARIPLDPEEVEFDYAETEVTGPSRTRGSKQVDGEATPIVRVALVGAARTHVEKRIALFAHAGAQSVQVTSDGVALANACRADAGGTATRADDPVAIVNLGAKTTNVAILFARGCWFRGSYFGCDHFDRELVGQLKCSWQKAEETRRRPSRATWMHQVDDALQPAFEGCAELIERTLAQFENEEGCSVNRVLLCGGGAEQFG
ncbi:MAG: pilus assembly protein PilM, partial [Planctomycetota bacterium]